MTLFQKFQNKTRLKLPFMSQPLFHFEIAGVILLRLRDATHLGWRLQTVVFQRSSDVCFVTACSEQIAVGVCRTSLVHVAIQPSSRTFIGRRAAVHRLLWTCLYGTRLWGWHYSLRNRLQRTTSVLMSISHRLIFILRLTTLWRQHPVCCWNGTVLF